MMVFNLFLAGNYPTKELSPLAGQTLCEKTQRGQREEIRMGEAGRKAETERERRTSPERIFSQNQSKNKSRF